MRTAKIDLTYQVAEEKETNVASEEIKILLIFLFPTFIIIMISTLIRYSFSHAKPLPSAKLYVERFAGLQGTLKDELKKIN